VDILRNVIEKRDRISTFSFFFSRNRCCFRYGAGH